ncbi:hypothetical protein SISNIDRAFT_33316 [Sistotremastrum niveocremeum HHB9708]|uniref:MYND-type domain-containing protein n=1 Tax=Sistotremastrum niveocremeum HHB9708 TaxID=1314777 RepID=A0A164W8V3_9AGAM|nr:hypothetical protein SISNIDRAFT_33316 [Sistotremastrum niveocremeum HHB9708]
MTSREEILHILRSLRVELPVDSKISEQSLLEKLYRALDCAQLAPQRLPASGIVPQSLFPWDRGPLRRPFCSENSTEDIGMLSVLLSVGVLSTMERNDFVDFRLVLLRFAEEYDKGIRSAVVRDQQPCYLTLIKFVKVLKLNDTTPLIVVLYQHAVRKSQVEPDTEGPLSSFPCVPGSRGVQQILYLLLHRNAARLPEAYKAPREPDDTDMEYSFIMPTEPLSLADLHSLSKDKACNVCGRKALKHCAVCELVVYCSKDCQKQAWPSHKTQCRALSSSVWTAIKFQSSCVTTPLSEGMPFSNTNQYTPTDEVQSTSRGPAIETEDPPPNHYGTKPFIIKIRTSDTSVMVYDHWQTLNFWLMSSNDPVNFRRLSEAASTGSREMQCYRWAKRISDLELSVCLDLKLPEEPRW